MKKNQKILAAVAAIIVVVLIVVGVMISTKNTNEETSSSTNVETSEVVATEESTKVESSTEVLASIGTAPEDSTSSVDKSDAINFPGSETSETSTSESATDSSNTESSTSKTESTTESTTSSASKTETSASSTSETSTSESSTSVTSTSVEPTTSESSTTPSTPVDNSSSTPSTPAGEQITQGSTGTTSLGTTYPIVSEFNKVGLNPNNDNFFTSGSTATEFTEAMGQANKSLGEALGYRSNDTPIDATNTYISYLDAHISRKPESGYYVWVYAGDITDSTDGGTSSRAAHQVMLGAITSTPAEVENALFEATFGNNSYGLDENGASWTTVGDCKLIWAYGDESQQMYFIKPAN